MQIATNFTFWRGCHMCDKPFAVSYIAQRLSAFSTFHELSITQHFTVGQFSNALI